MHYSARILFQELRRDRGYTGSYDTVRNAVRPLRAEATVASLTQLRFETGPGEQVQVDWGQVRICFANGPAEAHIFVMTLGCSRRAWVEAFSNEHRSTARCARARVRALRWRVSPSNWRPALIELRSRSLHNGGSSSAVKGRPGLPFADAA